jgi:hypothetical protein
MTEEKETPQIIKGDKKYRNVLFGVYIVLLGFGLFFFILIFPFLLTKFRHLELHASFIIAEIVIISFLLVFILPASYLISIGRKIKRYAQFPYPGMKVLRDTQVLSGPKALFRAKMLIYFGCFACLISMLSAISVFRIFHKIFNSELIRQLPLFQ